MSPTRETEPGSTADPAPPSDRSAAVVPLVATGTGLLASLRRNLALQDAIVVAFHAYLLGFVLLAGEMARGSQLLGGGFLLLGVFVVLLVRGQLVPAGIVRAVLYRAAIVFPIPGSYALFRDAAPSVEHRLRDTELLAIDRALFGETPAVLMEPWKSPAVVEWFSAFYYGYYPLLIGHVVGSMFLDKGRRLHEMMFGAMTVVVIGHVVYTLVPALGPQFTMDFARELSGGFFWDRVHDTVHGSGARIDVFPSLHTALPTFFALHSLRHRRGWPYRYTWPITLLVVTQIVVATMLLRWHYGVDIVAGVLVALLAQQVAIRAARHEDGREASGRQPVWEPLAWSRRVRERS